MEYNPALRWFIDRGLWSFGAATPYEFIDRARPYTLEGVAERIRCPVLVCEAETDQFNPGQAKRLAAVLGDRAKLRPFTAAESAGIHAHPGASVLLNGVVLDWLTETVEDT
jgi:pimeloyl-ACP methyl ester carboxylesterase